MGLKCDFADAEFAGGLLIEKATDHEWQHFLLSRGQTIEALAKIIQVCPLGAIGAVTVQRREDAACW